MTTVYGWALLAFAAAVAVAWIVRAIVAGRRRIAPGTGDGPSPFSPPPRRRW